MHRAQQGNHYSYNHGPTSVFYLLTFEVFLWKKIKTKMLENEIPCNSRQFVYSNLHYFSTLH